MARWDKLTSRGNVIDRRGIGPVAVGGLSLTGVAIVLLVNLLGGGDVTDVLTQIEQVEQVNQLQEGEGEFAGEDPYEVFASTVLGSNSQLWESVFAQNDLDYTEPRLVLFRGATQSGCGVASSQVGPHYCPLDSTIYLDETFFDELTTRFGAQGGDVAEAYVIAHEVAHHVQNELGIMDQVQEQSSSRQRANELSVNLELQADCLAGVWANSIRDQGVLLPGRSVRLWMRQPQLGMIVFKKE